MTLHSELNELLANNKLDKAIDLLMERTKERDKDIYNTLILLKARYNSNENDNNMGIVSRGDYQRTKAQITYSFQQTMNNIPSNIMKNNMEEIHDQSFNNEKYPLQKEIDSYHELHNKMTDKKTYLEKELITTYDAEKKFSLKEQIKELDRQINELKQKMSGESKIVSQNIIITGNKETKSNVFHGISNSTINIGTGSKSQKDPSLIKHVLFICSSPSGKNPLDFGAEFKKIKEAKQKGTERDNFDIEIETGVEADDLINKLSSEPLPYIVHISMHSSKSEGLYFEDQNKKENPISVENFREIFELLAELHKPELVILSACNSIKHAEAIKPFANHVLGTVDFLPDNIAIIYAKKFYEMIFNGKTIDFAHKAAILSIKQAPIPSEDKNTLKTPIHEIPVLI